jgi:hypothetical protein
MKFRKLPINTKASKGVIEGKLRYIDAIKKKFWGS